jgi:hypothetical protein
MVCGRGVLDGTCRRKALVAVWVSHGPVAATQCQVAVATLPCAFDLRVGFCDDLLKTRIACVLPNSLALCLDRKYPAGNSKSKIRHPGFLGGRNFMTARNVPSGTKDFNQDIEEFAGMLNLCPEPPTDGLISVVGQVAQFLGLGSPTGGVDKGEVVEQC